MRSLWLTRVNAIWSSKIVAAVKIDVILKFISGACASDEFSAANSQFAWDINTYVHPTRAHDNSVL